MHHKRKRPKSRRAGCLLCKPHKANGCCPRHLDMRFGNRRRLEATRAQLACVPTRPLDATLIGNYT